MTSTQNLNTFCQTFTSVSHLLFIHGQEQRENLCDSSLGMGSNFLLTPAFYKWIHEQTLPVNCSVLLASKIVKNIMFLLVIHHCSVCEVALQRLSSPLRPNGGWAGGVRVWGGVRVSTSTVCQGMLRNAGISNFVAHSLIIATDFNSYCQLEVYAAPWDRSLLNTGAFNCSSICPSTPTLLECQFTLCAPDMHRAY